MIPLGGTLNRLGVLEGKLNDSFTQAVRLSVPGQSPVDCEHDICQAL
jgi:hypothetical protein